MKKLPFLCLLLALLVPTCGAFAQFDPNGQYMLVAKHNGLVLDVGCDDVFVPTQPNSKRDNVCVFGSHGGDNQHWRIQPNGDGSFRLSAVHNGKSLDVGCDDVFVPTQPNSKRDNVCVFSAHSGANQRWEFTRLPDGAYRITVRHNHKVLDVGCDDVPNAAHPNSQRNNVCVFDWHGGDNQHWYVIRVR
jgi:hypothetical protein